MLRCEDCCDGKGAAKCTACKAMQEESKWVWSPDNGNRRITCPYCQFSMAFGAYRYDNPYNYCPGCGEKLKAGEQTRMDI